MEHENKYANIANTGLGFGIAGTALGLMAGGLNGTGIFGGNNCGDNAYVNRFESQQNAKIAELETEVKLRDANTFTMGELGKFRDYVDRRIERLECQLSDQKVYNATNTATINCIAGQVQQLMSLTKLVVPNASICPGWGEATVSIATTTT